MNMFWQNLYLNLFTNTWHWAAAGAGIGLTALALAWFTGKKLGVTGGFVDACGIVTKASTSGWKLWFILGLPLGGFAANLGHWSWTLTYGQLDALTFGTPWIKILWLLVSGFLIGFGARWAGGCTSGNSIMGVALGSKMSILATIVFLAAGILVVNILFKAVL
jgi:uncharacterized membrane protein YedE/YeeE